jgi:magnesium-transporting ATPase (P-type)
MSTIAKSSIIGEDLFIYTKGSPEHMHDIFNKKTIPKSYFKTLKKYTCMGFRILAIGHKSIKN